MCAGIAQCAFYIQLYVPFDKKKKIHVCNFNKIAQPSTALRFFWGGQRLTQKLNLVVDFYFFPFDKSDKNFYYANKNSSTAQPLYFPIFKKKKIFLSKARSKTKFGDEVLFFSSTRKVI